MTKIAIDRGVENFVLSDLAVLKLYLMGYEHIQVVAHGLGDEASIERPRAPAGMHAARMLSLTSMLELYEEENKPELLLTAPTSWVSTCKNKQVLNSLIQLRGNAALVNEHVYIFGDPDDSIMDGDAWRADPELIQVIELIAEDASGAGSDLRVVEIPGGVDWGIVNQKGIPEWIQERYVRQGSGRGVNRKARTWCEPHAMPPVHGGADTSEYPYVLASDLTEEDWSYASAMNFCGACPMPKNIRHSALYPWDYERWFYWRMAQGDDWRERAKSKWWFDFVHE